eukprot:4036673-Amphidinium_carterae.1
MASLMPTAWQRDLECPPVFPRTQGRRRLVKLYLAAQTQIKIISSVLLEAIGRSMGRCPLSNPHATLRISANAAS